MMSPTFKVGVVYMTKGIEEEIPTTDVFTALQKYFSRDWGIIPEEDKMLNDEVVDNEYGRLMGSYKTSTGRVIWIMTEFDRSYTTVLLPEEY